MKHTKLIIALLIGLPLIILVATLIPENDSSGNGDARMPVESIVYDTRERESGIDIYVPSAGYDSIDTWASNELARIENEYRASLDGLNLASLLQDPILTADLSTTEWNGYVSAILSIYEYTGGAHGYPYVITAVYDIDSETLLGLSDIIGSEDYLRSLSRLMLGKVSDLHEVFDGDTIRESLAPSATNYEQWSVGPDGIMFYFNPYVVAPYAAGIIEVLVTWEEIQELT